MDNLKNCLAVIVLSCFVSVHDVISQVTSNSLFNKPYQIESRLTVDTRPIPVSEVNTGGVRVQQSSSPSTTMYQRLFKTKPTDGQRADILLTVPQIKRKGAGFMNQPIDVDTDSPLPNNQAEELELERFQQLITAKSTATLPAGKPSMTASGDQKLLFNIPPLNAVWVLSGVVLNQLPDTDQWADTLQTDDGTYINTYRVTDRKNGLLQLALTGQFTSNGKDLAVDNTPIPMGMNNNIEQKTKVEKDGFTGTLLVEPNSCLIQSLKFTRTEERSNSLFGTMMRTAANRTYEMVNTVKK